VPNHRAIDGEERKARFDVLPVERPRASPPELPPSARRIVERATARHAEAQEREGGAWKNAAHQPVVKVTASTEGGEAPRGQGATTENIGHI
jgi:hypothetical protein